MPNRKNMSRQKAIGRVVDKARISDLPELENVVNVSVGGETRELMVLEHKRRTIVLGDIGGVNEVVYEVPHKGIRKGDNPEDLTITGRYKIITEEYLEELRRSYL